MNKSLFALIVSFCFVQHAVCMKPETQIMTKKKLARTEASGLLNPVPESQFTRCDTTNRPSCSKGDCLRLSCVVCWGTVACASCGSTGLIAAAPCFVPFSASQWISWAVYLAGSCAVTTEVSLKSAMCACIPYDDLLN